MGALRVKDDGGRGWGVSEGFAEQTLRSAGERVGALPGLNFIFAGMERPGFGVEDEGAGEFGRERNH